MHEEMINQRVPSGTERHAPRLRVAAIVTEPEPFSAMLESVLETL